ncbi:Fur family transcriptional regulator [Mogibacterium diversum]|uniref:Fur family transcriptional regulator n=1 Tax=Mogibacterium diversum TaxID=114527 RepID=UPI0028D4BE6E|nr:transcriptional repressor [Mogibacterium diversum]
MIKYSKQRQAIKDQLSNRGDHPTAETLYSELKACMPNLSIATVYRNLKQLEGMGEISTIITDGATRYDYNVKPHAHFFCNRCGAVLDIDTDKEQIVKIGQGSFTGSIEGCEVNFYGLCTDCVAKSRA